VVGTQLAAVVVTDLVGSTEMRVRLGEDGAEALRRVHDQMLRAAVLECSGVVVKGLGDGLLAHFAGAADAVAAGVAIQQATVRHSQQRPNEVLDVRIGIAAGDVTFEDDDIFGTPVVEASRICAIAGGGQIVAADLVRVLSRGRGGHIFNPIGELELKGLPDAVSACEVQWRHLAPDDAETISVPLPGPLAAAGRFPFAGRVDARELLETCWKEACVDARRIVLLAGEPGIGKTRLVSELALKTHADGSSVILGRCFEEVGAPYAPFVEALRHLVTHCPLDLLDAHVGAVGSDLNRLVPELGRRIPDLPAAPGGDAELQRMRLFEAVVDLLGRAGERAPVLLVLDDLHWADASSVELLMWISRAVQPLRLAIVGTYRDTDVARSHPFGAALADLRRIPGVERLPLSGLDEAEVLTFMEMAGGHALPETGRELATLLWHETEGNPFFLQEVLVHLAESGAIVHDGTQWVATRAVAQAGVPEGVRDVIGRRLSTMDDDVNDVLRAASIVGMEFELGLLAVLTDREPVALLDLLESPCQRGLLVEAGVDRYRFAHGLIRQTLDEELAAGRRARLHRKAANALMAAPSSRPGEVARHLIEAGPLGDPDLATEAAERAALDAEANLAWEQAASWYRAAIDQSELAADEPSRTARLRIGLGTVMNIANAPLDARPHFLAAFEAARRAARVDLMTAAAVAYGGVRPAWLEYGDLRGLAMLEEVAPMVPADDLATRARLAIRVAAWHQLDPGNETKAHLLHAVELARQAGDPAVLLAALNIATYCGAYNDDAQAFDAHAAEALAIAHDVGDAHMMATALSNRALVSISLGRLAEGARIALDLMRFATDIGNSYLAMIATYNLNQIELMAGRLDVARARLAELLGDTTASAGENLLAFSQQLVLADLTDPPAMAELWVQTDAGHNPVASIFPWKAANLAWEGRHDDALAELATWREHVRPLCPGFIRSYTDTWAARVAWWCNDAATAHALYDDLLPYRAFWSYAEGASIAPVETALGQCAHLRGDLDLAVEHFEAAVAHTEREGYALGEMESHMYLAATLDALGRVDDARVHDAAGRSLAMRCAAPAFLARRAFAPYFQPDS
jgi:class 3 adenylate cyclase/tetratricopeptide (TPR) repeat protein